MEVHGGLLESLHLTCKPQNPLKVPSEASDKNNRNNRNNRNNVPLKTAEDQKHPTLETLETLDMLTHQDQQKQQITSLLHSSLTGEDTLGTSLQRLNLTGNQSKEAETHWEPA